jgi:uncharacterized protein YdgA (DUF945 family)
VNKLLIGGGVVLALGVAGAAVVGPNYLGEKIETVTKAQLAGAIDKPFKAELVKYERGVRSSEVEIKLGLDASCMVANATAQSGSDVFLLYRAHLNHGPFAGGMNAASFTGELLLPPALQAKYEEATGQKVLATFTGTYGFGGASNQTITMPKFDVKMDKETGKLQFLGATVDAKSDADGKKMTYVANLPGAVIESKEATVTLGAADFNAKLNRIAPGIWESESSGKLKDVVAVNGGKPLFKLEGFAFNASNTLDDKKMMTSKVNMTLAKMSASNDKGDSKKEYTNAVYEFVINNLAAEPMARISAVQNCSMVPVLQALMGSKAGGSGIAELMASSQAMNANNEATFKTMLADYKLIAAANPSIDIKKISVMTPDGLVDVNGQVKLVGILESDWANPLLLLQRFDATANVTFPAPLIPEGMQLMVTKSVTDGFATQKDKQLTTTFKWSQGKGTLNGKPIEKMLSGG